MRNTRTFPNCLANVTLALRERGYREPTSTVQLNAVTVAWRSILVEDCEDPIYENTPISRA
jgi:hypothetical protein